MKLEKREITLNEKDSLKDLFYLEERVLAECKKGETQDFRKETVKTLSVFRAETEEILKRIDELRKE